MNRITNLIISLAKATYGLLDVTVQTNRFGRDDSIFG